MRAALVTGFENTPQFSTFAEPVLETGEVLVHVTRAALSNLVKAQAAGTHYTSNTAFPFIPGADGAGFLDDGRRVYFAFPRAPFGAMAQKVPIPANYVTGLPAGVDDTTAAAIANPGMSSWAALVDRANFRRGESVLINGATGVSGRLAVQIAKYFGAKSIVATGRNHEQLRLLAASVDEVIALEPRRDTMVRRFRKAIAEYQVTVILDYLWGEPAAQIFGAIGGHGSSDAVRRIRFVQIGGSASPEVTIEAGTLRSSGLEVLGSGIGSVPKPRLVTLIGELLHAIEPAGLSIETVTRPLEDVETAWLQKFGGKRLVFEVKQ